MSATDADALYALLPAFLRTRDQTVGGGVLRALVGVIAEQAAVVADGLDQLYDDQFIETCAPWAVPYIGDLIGFAPLRPLGPGQPAATRAEVANTIGYRRRKGTLGMLEQLCFDVTGWPGVAVEYFTRISTTQYVRNHVRPGNAVVDVRSPMSAVDLGSAFDVVPRSVDVRRISSGRGRYNIPNVGLFVWRLRPYTSSGVPVRLVGTNQWTVDPFGGDVPLVNPVVASGVPFDLQGRTDVPFDLKRYPLFSELAPYATAPPLSLYLNGTRVPDDAVAWCDLSTWAAPTASGIDVAVDPELGRIVFATVPDPATAVTVDYTYAFSGDYGGGPYHRPVPPDEATLEEMEGVLPIASFAAADLGAVRNQVVEIADSGVHLGGIDLAPDNHLLVVRADDLQRPVLTGDLRITAVDGASVTLRGIGVGGSVIVSGEGRMTLRLEHCSVRGRIDWSALQPGGGLALDHTLSGPVLANAQVEVGVTDSAVDAGSDTGQAISAGGLAAAGSVTIASSTILGTVAARTIPLLENSIVTGTVVTTERQAGCVRYSFVPVAGSQTPRRFRCQPDLETSDEVAAALKADPALTAAEQAAIAATVSTWLLPSFTSRVPGAPGYLQLTDAAPEQIRAGAEDGDELGVFFGLFSGRRESNLAYRVNEYLRIGLEAGIIHAT